MAVGEGSLIRAAVVPKGRHLRASPRRACAHCVDKTKLIVTVLAHTHTHTERERERERAREREREREIRRAENVRPKRHRYCMYVVCCGVS